MRRFVLVLAVLVLLSLVVIPAPAHSGGTDSKGGHYDWSTGEYHYHHGYSAHQHYDMDGDGVIDCPYLFDDKTGHSSGTGAVSGVSVKTCSDGYTDGYKEGKQDGYDSGKRDGYDAGYDAGYEAGAKEAGEKAVEAYKEKLKKQITEWVGLVLFFAGFVGLPVFVILYGFILSVKKDRRDSSASKKAGSPTPEPAARTSAQSAGSAKPKAPKENVPRSGPYNFVPVSSSCFSHIGYKDGVLSLKFQTGSIYRYYGVPASVYKEMLNAPSKGKYFSDNIKDIFPYR